MRCDCLTKTEKGAKLVGLLVPGQVDRRRLAGVVFYGSYCRGKILARSKLRRSPLFSPKRKRPPVEIHWQLQIELGDKTVEFSNV
jgi:hypothetical protein